MPCSRSSRHVAVARARPDESCQRPPAPVILTNVSATRAEDPESYFRDLLEAAPDAIVIVSADGLIQLVNTQLERMFGYTRLELLGEPVEVLIPQRFRARHPGHRQHYFADPKVRPMGAGLSLRAVRRDGSEFPAEISLSPMQSSEGLLVTAAIRDVTERVRTEDTLREAKEAAEAAASAKTQFLANMSHEIRTPLTALLGFADLMLEPSLSESDRLNYALTIRRNGEHLLSVLNDILDVAMVESGKLTLEQVEFSPARLLSEIASLMRVRATEKGLSFRLEFGSPLPAAMRSDPTRLRQIVLNLVSNAVKFTEHGAVRVSVSCELEERERATLIVAVHDTGIGMDEAQVARIFKPFSQADASMTRRFGGSGLGLAICGPLVQALGGALTVQSAPRGGSTFQLRVPVQRVEGSPLIASPAEAALGAEVAPDREAALQLSGRVLLAEDGVDNQKLVSTLLRHVGIEVTVADNGRVAMELALAAAKSGVGFDLILMDMHMPELDGYAATAQLRVQGYRAPIIALTAHAMTGERERCLRAGCDEYLTKPIGRGPLIRTLGRFLPRSAAGRSLRTPPRRSSSPASAAPVVPLVSELANDAELADLVISFVKGLPAQLQSLNDAASRGDRGRLLSLAHQLKGAAGGYGFPLITELAGRLERQVKSDESFAAALDELSAVCSRAIAGLPRRSAAPPGVPRVLVIDDSPDSHALLAARLRSERLELITAMNAHQGVELALERAPDLVLLDLDLPDVSGLDVCRRLQTDPRTMNVPVLFLTGTEDPSVKAAALDLGAVDYVTKPFDPAELRARVRSALRTKHYHDMLATRAQLDGLTGLWNREYFDRRLQEELSAAQRHGQPLSIALIDLDHFKRVNDTYGHPFGDHTLQAFAAGLTRTVRTSDVACRYGGEEFVVILRQTGAMEALKAAERMRSMVAQLKLHSRGQPVPVTASLGVAALEQQSSAKPPSVRPELLIQAADTALYRAKNEGRNRVVLASTE